MDAHERELERAAIGGDRDAQTQLRELWRRTGRDLLPVHVRRGAPAVREWIEAFSHARLAIQQIMQNRRRAEAIAGSLLAWLDR